MCVVVLVEKKNKTREWNKTRLHAHEIEHKVRLPSHSLFYLLESSMRRQSILFLHSGFVCRDRRTRKCVLLVNDDQFRV